MEVPEIEEKDCNLNISAYISTVVGKAEIDLGATTQALGTSKKDIPKVRDTHNGFLQELGLPALP